MLLLFLLLFMQVKKPDCGQLSSGCGPYHGDKMFEPNSEISIFSSNCERFVCNEDSYVVRQVNPECKWSRSPHSFNGEGGYRYVTSIYRTEIMIRK